MSDVNDDAPLTEQQQMMMAYIDGELSPSERTSFEQAMQEDPELSLETVKFKNLMDLSRSMALSEPTDHEIRRFWGRFYNRTEWQVGWIMLLSGLVVLACEGLYLLVVCDWSWWLKGAVLFTVAGGLILIWNAVRLKLRTSHFDRYRGVMR